MSRKLLSHYCSSIFLAALLLLTTSEQASAQTKAELKQHATSAKTLVLEQDDPLVGILLNNSAALEEDPLQDLVAGGDATCQARGRNSCSTSNGCVKCERDDIEIDVGPLHLRIPRCYCDVQPDDIQESTSGGGAVSR